MTGTVPGGRVVELAAVPPLGAAYARALTRTWRSVGIPPHGPLRGGPGGPPELRVSGTQVGLARLTAYQHLIGTPAGDRVPAGFVHVLTFPLAMAVMTDRAFPLPVIGLVHLSNRITQHRPVRFDESLDLTARAERVRLHHRGTCIDLVTTAAVDGQPVWTGVSTYLAKSKPTGDRPDQHPGSPSSHREPVTALPTGRWQVPADEGRQYAAVSGDRNPIHVSRAGARLFGFRRPIMHGMDAAARLLAATGPACPQSFDWSVEFAAPILLPATVLVQIATDDAGLALTAWRPSDGRAHLIGRIDPLPGQR